MSGHGYDETECVRSAAYHEAGHAALLVLFRQKIVRIEIHSDGRGFTESSACISVDERIMVLQAGSACMDAFNVASVDTGGAERDYGEIITLLDEHFLKQTEVE